MEFRTKGINWELSLPNGELDLRVGGKEAIVRRRNKRQPKTAASDPFGEEESAEEGQRCGQR